MSQQKPLIIDCHGHYTTAPKALENWRNAQIAGIQDPAAMPKVSDLKISDDELRESIETNQLRLMKERGSDITIFSPRASFMAHHIGDFNISSTWAAICNELCYRVSQLFPDHFVPAAMLPQSPGVDPATCIPELEKCVKEYGNVGINLNPDPSGGHWTSPPLTDRHWYPIYEKMVEYDIPAMIHVSTSCNACFHTTGAHYLNADTTAFMQLPPGRPVQGLPDAEVHHSPRRRRRAVPLGPLPRPGAGDEEAAAQGPPAEQRVLRHLRLPPAGHRPADPGDPGGQHPVCVAK
jgi:4-oxalmesaconate hydratase